jgi:hypothetical protein
MYLLSLQVALLKYVILNLAQRRVLLAVVHLSTCNVYVVRIMEQDRECMYNVTLRHSRASIVAVEKQ